MNFIQNNVSDPFSGDETITHDSSSLSDFAMAFPDKKSQEDFAQIFSHITQYVDDWKCQNLCHDDFTYNRLSGNSNACYKVKLRDHIARDTIETRTVLYRKYLQTVVDKSVEQMIFKA